jgi:hypothetical protein
MCLEFNREIMSHFERIKEKKGKTQIDNIGTHIENKGT